MKKGIAPEEEKEVDTKPRLKSRSTARAKAILRKRRRASEAARLQKRGGRPFPPWEAPDIVPTLNANPKDVAILRACGIPRDHAMAWLSGKSVRNFKSSHLLPHSVTWLSRHDGRFKTKLLDRSAVLERLRAGEMGPSSSSLANIVKEETQPAYTYTGPGPAFAKPEIAFARMKVGPSATLRSRIEDVASRNSSDIPGPAACDVRRASTPILGKMGVTGHGDYSSIV